MNGFNVVLVSWSSHEFKSIATYNEIIAATRILLKLLNILRIKHLSLDWWYFKKVCRFGNGAVSSSF